MTVEELMQKLTELAMQGCGKWRVALKQANADDAYLCQEVQVDRKYEEVELS